MRLREPLLAAAACLLFFGGIEGLLFAAGVPTLASRSDPYQGFSERMRVFELDAERGVYRTRPQAEHLSFNRQEFLARKPANGLRVFVIGGSSTYGFPWTAEEAFSSALRDALAASRPDRHVEVVNAGAMSYASHRLRVLTHELAGYEPDLIVVDAGHNEFVERRFYRDVVERPESLGRLRALLHHSRLYSALARFYRDWRASAERGGPGAAPGDADGAASLLGLDVSREPPAQLAEAERQEIVRRFEENLRAIIDLAEAAGARVVLCTVASNLSGWAPNRSAWDPETDAATQRRVEAMLARAGAALAAGDAAAASADLELARELAPGHARTHYELGRALTAQQRWGAAADAFVRARDLDASPSRAPSAINAAVRRVAAERGALLVDVEAALARTAPNGLVGFELFEDYVHPKPATHLQIAREIWAALETSGWVGEARPADPAVFERALAQRPSAPSDADRMKAAMQLFNLGVVLSHQGLASEAIEKFRACLALAPEYSGARNNLAWLLHQQGSDAEAVREYRELLRREAGNRLALAGLGETLRSMGRLDAAARVLERATRSDPGSAPAFGRLAVVRYDQRRFDLAEATALRAIELDPGDSDSRAILGLALLEQGRLAEAAAALEAGLARAPDHPAMREGLADVYRRVGRSEDAEALLRGGS